MAAAAPPVSERWLYGPARDLLIGCGLWYAVALALFQLAGREIRDAGALTLMPFAVLVFSTPHYGATLLRVYRHGEDRRAYRFFTVYASVVLALLFAGGVHSAWLGSWIVTVYVTWSPWHYSGQNYGLASMFLRRRGVELDDVTRRWLYASFVLAYGVTFLALHSGGSASHFVPLGEDPVNYRFIGLGIPAPYSDVALAGVGLAYGVSLVVSAARLLRRGSVRDLAPAVALVATQALWFSLPLLARAIGLAGGVEPWASSYGSYYFMWIAIGHSIQYLWITSYYAKREGDWTGEARYLVQALLAGAAIWTIPTLVFAPGALGRLPYDGGFAILAASVVNLHHFVLDGAIWKLRDGRVARILLRDRGETERFAPPSAAVRGLGRVVWAAGAVSLAIMFYAKWEGDVAIPRASEGGDVVRAQASMDRLAWVGRDSAKLRRLLGDTLVRRGSLDAAIAQYERANEIRETVDTWYRIGRVQEKTEKWRRAADSYETALAINDEEANVLYRLGLVRMKLGEYEGARWAFERAFALNPERRINETMIERADRALRESAKDPQATGPSPATDS